MCARKIRCIAGTFPAGTYGNIKFTTYTDGNNFPFNPYFNDVTIYAAVTQPENGSAVEGELQIIYKSTNGGESWAGAATPVACGGVNP